MAASTTASTGTAASTPATAGGTTRADTDTAATHPVTTTTRSPTSRATKGAFETFSVLNAPFMAPSRRLQPSSNTAPTGAPAAIPAAMSCAAAAP